MSTFSKSYSLTSAVALCTVFLTTYFLNTDMKCFSSDPDPDPVKAKAEEVITELYGFKEEGMEVLFKPTKASEVPIRHDYDQAVSYFVGAAAAGDEIGIKEDKGFAINPWTAVRFENSKTILNADSATAMGEYYFTTLEGTVAKVEYTFQYKRGADGNLKIVVHHSSLPYSP